MGALRQLWNLSGGLDLDAKAYITAVGLTDSAQISSVDTFVKNLKSNGLWTKMYAVYPFIGGTASAHKWNLKDPRDLDAAYRLTYNGTATHNSYGIDWPSSNTINANTHYNPNSDPFNLGITAYIGKNQITNTIMGAFDGSKSMYLRVAGSRRPVGFFYAQSPGSTIPQPQLDYYNNFGVLTLNRTNASYLSLHRSGNKLGSLTYTETGTINANIYLNNITASQSGFGGNSRMQFAAIHKGLLDSEAVIFTTLINNLQSGLSRTFYHLDKTIWLLGDSITFGQSATSHGTSWAGIVSQTKFYYEQNTGIPGYTTQQVIDNSLALVNNKTINDIYVVLSIGINDIPTTSVSDYKTKLTSVINSLMTKGYDNTNIILPTIYWTPSKNGSTPPYNTAINELWASFNLQIKPDVYQAIVDNGGGASLFHADGIHPLDAGHTVVAAEILSKIP
jgi:lysophospholipase L1-like esterase